MLNILPTRAFHKVNMLQKTKKLKSVQEKIRDENTLTIWLKKHRESD